MISFSGSPVLRFTGSPVSTSLFQQPAKPKEQGEATQPVNWRTGERELDDLIHRFTGSPARQLSPHFCSNLPED
jgi:hypothetical protein